MLPTALITGGTRGIGLGIAAALAKQGWQLALNGVRPQEQVESVLSNLRQLGANVAYCRGDISSAADREAMLDEVRAQFGCLHLLVNNAGIAPKTRLDLLETTPESWDSVINTNLRGTFFLTQAAAKWMIEQKTKINGSSFVPPVWSIVNISSISATVASINRGEYCVAKAGLTMVTQLFAARLGANGIMVYEIRPGITKTDMTAAVTDKYDKLIASGLTVQPRWGLPDDIGKAVAALARGDFPYSTGQVFTIDGGLTLPRL